MMRRYLIVYDPFAYDSDDSLWSDFVADCAFARDFPHGVNNDEWTTQDGRTLKIASMTTQHIQNCMKMIEREGMNDEFYYVLEAELKRRRENAERIIREREQIDLPEEIPF